MTKPSACSADVILGSGYVITLSELKGAEMIASCMNIGLNFELYSCKSVEVFGTLYYCGCYLLTAIENGVPMFVKLEHILSRQQGEHLWLICHQLITECFDSHFHAWKVIVPRQLKFVCVEPRCLHYVLPLSLHCLNDGKYIAGLRYRA
jgi:hypothetical protein